MKAVIGIDFGNTNACVSVMRSSGPEVVANDLGNRATPCYLAFTGDEVLVGEPAEKQAPINAANTVHSIRTLLVSNFSSPEVQALKATAKFTITEGKDDTNVVTVQVKGKAKNFTAVDLAALIFGQMKKIAGAYLGDAVTQCVLTAPAYFSSQQRTSLQNAAAAGGLTVLSVVTEAAASAIAHNLDEGTCSSANVLIVDVGGATCDVSILSVHEGLLMSKAHTSAPVGGNAIDSALVKHFATDFERKNKVVLQGEKGDLVATSKLAAACRRAKKILTSEASCEVECESLFQGKDLFTTLSIQKFEMLTNAILKRITAAVETALAKVEEQDNITSGDISHVILAGGCSHVKKVQEVVTLLLPNAEFLSGVAQEEVVVCGAAVQASIFANRDSSIPEKNAPSFPLSGSTISMASEDEVGVVLVPKGTPLPFSRDVMVTTATDNQTQLLVQLFQGERLLSAHNTKVAEFAIKGLQKEPTGKATASMSVLVSEAGDLSISQASVPDLPPIVVKAQGSTGASATSEQRAWDKAMQLWLDASKEVIAYIESIQNGVLKAGVIADTGGTVSKLCSSTLGWISDTHKSLSDNDRDSLLGHTNEAKTRQSAIAAIVAAQMTTKANEDSDDEGDESDEGETDEEEDEEDLD